MTHSTLWSMHVRTKYHFGTRYACIFGFDRNLSTPNSQKFWVSITIGKYRYAITSFGDILNIVQISVRSNYEKLN